MNKIKLQSVFNFLDSSEYSFDQDTIKNHCVDWRGDFIGSSEMIIFPKSIETISKVIGTCEKKKYRLFLKVEIQV